MADMLGKLIPVLVGVVIFIALFGFIVTSINGFNWKVVNAGGTSVDLSWAPYVLILLLVIGFVYLGYSVIRGKQ